MGSKNTSDNLSQIKWNLNQIMSDKNISGIELATRMNKHPNTISRLRKTNEMPNINGKMLGNLCQHLGCSPVDLIQFIPSGKNTEKIKIEDQIFLITTEIFNNINSIVEIPSDKITAVMDQIRNVLKKKL